jgi:hypothetical protein
MDHDRLLSNSASLEGEIETGQDYKEETGPQGRELLRPGPSARGGDARVRLRVHAGRTRRRDHRKKRHRHQIIRMTFAAKLLAAQLRQHSSGDVCRDVRAGFASAGVRAYPTFVMTSKPDCSPPRIPSGDGG